MPENEAGRGGEGTGAPLVDLHGHPEVRDEAVPEIPARDLLQDVRREVPWGGVRRRQGAGKLPRGDMAPSDGWPPRA